MANSIAFGLAAAMLLAAAIVPIIFSNSNKFLARGAYAVRMISVLAFDLLLGMFALPIAKILGDFAFLIFLIIWVFQILWTVHRLQDLQWSKWLALLMVVPLVNVVFVITLMLKPGIRKNGEQPQSELSA